MTTPMSGATPGALVAAEYGYVTVADDSAAATYVATLPQSPDETAQLLGTDGGSKIYRCSKRAFEKLAGTFVSPPGWEGPLNYGPGT